jgi:plasmid maintenance system antidote protein VapI
MNKQTISTNKIKKAISRGDLIPYADIFSSYSPQKQQEIVSRAKYIKAAMELKKLRNAMKISQSLLAQKMNVKREFITRIESGQQNITIETLYRVAEATGKNLEFHFV